MKEPLLRRICPCTGVQLIRLLEFALWFIVAITLICVPSYLVSRFPGSWNTLSEVLFQMVTAFLSVFIGYRLSKASSDNQITRKWLPPAQAACNQIQVMKAQVLRLRKTRRTTCDELKELLAAFEESQRQPIEKVVQTKCESCKARLLDIQDHLANAYETWRIFIQENCKKIIECENIEYDLTKFAESLKHEDEDVP